MAPRADDHEVGVFVLGGVEQPVGGSGEQQRSVRTPLPVSGLRPFAVEATLGLVLQFLVLLRRDLGPGQARRRGSATSSRFDRKREPARPPERRGRGLGAVDTDQDAHHVTGSLSQEHSALTSAEPRCQVRTGHLWERSRSPLQAQ